MDPRRTRSRAAAASLALAALTAAGAVQAQQEGWLLAGIRRTIPNPHMAELIDLHGGARRALPMSSSSLSGGVNVDIWWSSHASARTLLRADDRGNADVFDSDTLRLLDSFSLASLPGTRRPIFLGTPRLSPDGQYVLAYWIRDVRSMNSELTIFDRKGRELRQVSSSPENDRNWVGAFAWAPRKGRYVLLDDEGIHVCQLGSASCLTASAAVRVVDAAGGVHELGVAAAPPQDVLKAGGAPVTICSFMQWVP